MKNTALQPLPSVGWANQGKNKLGIKKEKKKADLFYIRLFFELHFGKKLVSVIFIG